MSYKTNFFVLVVLILSAILLTAMGTRSTEMKFPEIHYIGGKTIYDHFKIHVSTLNLRLDCYNNTGGGVSIDSYSWLFDSASP